MEDLKIKTNRDLVIEVYHEDGETRVSIENQDECFFIWAPLTKEYCKKLGEWLIKASE